jgi:hypothetical protein
MIERCDRAKLDVLNAGVSIIRGMDDRLRNFALSGVAAANSEP